MTNFLSGCIQRLFWWCLAPRDEWPPKVAWSWLFGLFCLLFAQLVAALWAGTSQRLTVEELAVGNTGLWVCYVLVPIFCFKVLSNDEDWRRSLSLSISLNQVFSALLVGLICNLVVLAGLYRLIAVFSEADPSAAARSIVELADGYVDVAILAVLLIVVAPVTEELMFRGLLLPTLTDRFGLTAGVVLSSGLFAYVHLGAGAIVLPGIFCLALVLAVLTAFTGRLGVAMVVHASFNGASLLQLL